jgi:hypothetical protein
MEYTDEQKAKIIDEFHLLINEMPDKQFWEYVSTWKSSDDIVDQMIEWDIETKAEAINEIKALLKRDKADWKKLENRDKIIQELVQEDIEDIKQAMQSNDYEFLDRVLRGEGWNGYDNMTDKELSEEYNTRKK